MNPLNAFDVLTIWDESSGRPLLEKSIRLLAKAMVTDQLDIVWKLSIGERDSRLLLLREWMFGQVLKMKSECPACKEVVEWETNTAALRLQPLRPAIDPTVFILEKEAFTIRFRLPDSYDLASVMGESDNPVDDKKIILDCVVEVVQNGIVQPPDVLQDEILQALEQRMSEEDPQADIRMNLVCTACANKWETRFDIGSFLWAEIDNWAYRLMDEVALLARAFGWPEKDIVNMSARRRHIYIQMLGV